MLSRLLIVAISAGAGYSVAPELAHILGRSEILAVVIVTVFSYAALDVAASLFTDREFLKDVIKSRVGGKR